MAKAYVNGVGWIEKQTKTLDVTKDGTYNITPDQGKMLSGVTVNVDTPGVGKDLNTEIAKKDVNFYDYDGTLLYSFTVAEAKALIALPELPTQEGLICQGWNYDLETIKEYNRAVDVGATYITDDGKTRLYVKIAAFGRMDVPLYFSQTVANGVIVDWGDGSDTETLSSTGNVNTTHTYASIGEYVISLDVAEGCTLGLGHGSLSYCVMGSTTNNNKVYCNMLQKVEMGRNASLSGGAFNNCHSLSSVAIPEGVTKINNSAFIRCYSLEGVVLPEGVTSISGGAFNDCFSLEGLVIPDTVTSIGDSAFGGCRSLSKIVIPERVTILNGYLFQYCRSLSSVVIPDSVTSIGSGAFDGCYSLANTIIPEGVTSIGSGAFGSCFSLDNIIIPEGVTSIGGGAFNNCYSLSKIVMPDGVTNIGSNTFGSCYSLANMIMPKSVTSIGNSTFGGCSGMKYYDFTRCTSVPTLSSGALAGIPSDCEIRVPAALYNEWIAATNWSAYADHIVAGLGAYAFYGREDLTRVVIPYGVTSIGAYAFAGCSGCLAYDFSALEAIPVLADASVFEGINADAKILVPGSLYFEWTRADDWSEYMAHIVPIGEIILVPSEGFAYTYDTQNNYYILTDIGDCTDTDLVIPETYDDGEHGSLPVYLDADAFRGNSNITSVYIMDGVRGYDFGDAFAMCPSLEIVEGLHAITQSFALAGCPSLKYVKFAKEVGEKGVGGYGFHGSRPDCVFDFSLVEKIPYLTYQPWEDYQTFDNLDGGKIIVPAQLYDEWIVDTNWSMHADHIVAAK